MKRKPVSLRGKTLAYITPMRPGTTWLSLSDATNKYNVTAKRHFKNSSSSSLAFIEHCEGYV